MTLAAMAGSASAGKVSCSEAAAKVEAQGYEIMSTTCGGKTHTFSMLEGEAVLVKVDARTGKLRAIYGGD